MPGISQWVPYSTLIADLETVHLPEPVCRFAEGAGGASNSWNHIIGKTSVGNTSTSCPGSVSERVTTWKRSGRAWSSRRKASLNGSGSFLRAPNIYPLASISHHMIHPGLLARHVVGIGPVMCGGIGPDTMSVITTPEKERCFLGTITSTPLYCLLQNVEGGNMPIAPKDGKLTMSSKLLHKRTNRFSTLAGGCKISNRYWLITYCQHQYTGRLKILAHQASWEMVHMWVQLYIHSTSTLCWLPEQHEMVGCATCTPLTQTTKISNVTPLRHHKGIKHCIFEPCQSKT